VVVAVVVVVVVVARLVKRRGCEAVYLQQRVLAWWKRADELAQMMQALRSENGWGQLHQCSRNVEAGQDYRHRSSRSRRNEMRHSSVLIENYVN